MSGHSHWAKVKRAKAVTDARRGKLWSKLARRIIVAAKTGGGNPDENLQLRYAIEDARAANVPKDTIANAINRGTGELGEQEFERVIYEGYAPGGVAIMVDCLTDNRNRTASEVRKIFERAGGQLGGSNCVAYMFAPKGTFTVPTSAVEEDRLIEICLEAGAEDVRKEADVFEVTCDPGSFGDLKKALADNQIETIAAEIAMVPDTTVAVDEDRARQALGLMEAFEDHDDVQNVYSNFDIPDHVGAKLEAESR
ncbi:MAG: transcriptional regulator [Phycisphaerae bacterium SM23_33]|jgi:YebC/PmpR family DNA-binding regulatory protein|nr:MAG: transcriptional regulator [Phycisphaerae bacterium SM23_33]